MDQYFKIYEIYANKWASKIGRTNEFSCSAASMSVKKNVIILCSENLVVRILLFQ